MLGPLENSVRFPHLLKANILKDLSADFQKDFLNHCAVIVYDKPETILLQGAESKGMYLIAHGSVEITFLGKNGQKAFISRDDVGVTFGDIEAISGRTCAATCEAAKNTVLLFCPTTILLMHLKNLTFVRNLVAEYHRSMIIDNVFRLIDQFSQVTQRLCSYLLFLSEKKPLINETQANLAEMVGCSRQTMNKELGKLRDLGLIEIKNRAVEVLDRAGLQEFGAETV